MHKLDEKCGRDQIFGAEGVSMGFAILLRSSQAKGPCLDSSLGSVSTEGAILISRRNSQVMKQSRWARGCLFILFFYQVLRRIYMGKNIVVTNNPLVKAKYQDKVPLEYYDIGYLELLMKVRDKVHLGYKLLTHPLSSSVKPNETPYKTVIISEGSGLDSDSLLIIENSILTTKKFLNDISVYNWEDKILEDFQVVDLSIIEPAINKIL